MNARGSFVSIFAWPLKGLVRTILSPSLYQQMRVTFLGEPFGLGLDWRWANSLRRPHPLRRDFGWQAGQTIDRYYTEQHFLPACRADIRGTVLEVGDDRYTREFGAEKVTVSEVLHLHPNTPGATICADLSKADHIPSHSFDCIILTFTLQFIFDVRAAIRTLARILKPGGVALLVFPGISQISRYDMDNWGEFWRFTSLSARKLFEESFRPEDVTVTTYGNVLAATASLQGLISSELRREELDHWDRDYELLIGVRAVKR